LFRGLFVPNLLAGACLGRIIGQLLAQHLMFLKTVNSSTYALIGAAAMLGGMARMTISLTVILIESTGDLKHGLAIMLTLITAKWVGDYFNEGLYDIHIHLKGLQFLEWFSPDVADFLLAMDIMTTKVQCFSETEKVSNVLRVLERYDHNCFPIVADGKSRSFRGIILRKHLITILKSKQFFDHKPNPYENPPTLTEDDFEGCYPRYPTLPDVRIPQRILMNAWIDLTPYMNPAPYVIQEHSPVSHVFNIFRTMGLRHLCVVNKINEIVGIITRSDLSSLKLQFVEQFVPPC
jgi:chloride channel 7